MSSQYPNGWRIVHQSPRVPASTIKARCKYIPTPFLLIVLPHWYHKIWEKPIWYKNQHVHWNFLNFWYALEVKLIRIKFPTNPIEHRFMFFVFGILNCIQKIGVSPNTPTVLWGTCLFPFNNYRRFRKIYRKNFFENDFMLPTITEVIFINKTVERSSPSGVTNGILESALIIVQLSFYNRSYFL